MSIVSINYIEIVDGKPQIIGRHGLTVYDVVALYVWNASPLAWILENYDLSAAEVYAALSYYYDHKDEVDAAMRAETDLARRHAIPSEEMLARLRRAASESSPPK